MQGEARGSRAPAGIRRSPLGFGRRALGTRHDRMVHAFLHELSNAIGPLRSGLESKAAYRSAKAVRQLLDVAAAGISRADGSLLAFVGTEAKAHAVMPALLEVTAGAIEAGKTRTATVTCDEVTCGLGEAIAAPLPTRGETAGALVVVTARHQAATSALTRSTNELAHHLATELDLGAAERDERGLRDVRLAALRSQMSPHFVYNTITAIASLVRTDPERARELLFRFAELCRYVLRRDHVTIQLADELQIVHVYVELERARKGDDRIEIVFRIDPAALGATIPMMTLQPLVENAVQHGLAGHAGRGVVTIEADDRGHELELTVADNGQGMDPELVAALHADDSGGPGPVETGSVAIANVRARLDAAFGADARFDVTSAPGEGTTVRLRFPKEATL